MNDETACCTTRSGQFMAEEFYLLDRLGVKLICWEARFSEPLREMGKVWGGKIASLHTKPPQFEAALDLLLPACGLDQVVDFRWTARTVSSSVLSLSSCSQALGCAVPEVGRMVCHFSSGLFEGFLRGVWAESRVDVQEISCLGMGHATCDFRIDRL